MTTDTANQLAAMAREAEADAVKLAHHNRRESIHLSEFARKIFYDLRAEGLYVLAESIYAKAKA